jgi:hypothetical protein
VAARIAKRFDEEIGAAVDDFGVIAEVGLGVDHAEQFDHRLDGVSSPIADFATANNCRPVRRAAR